MHDKMWKHELSGTLFCYAVKTDILGCVLGYWTFLGTVRASGTFLGINIWPHIHR